MSPGPGGRRASQAPRRRYRRLTVRLLVDFVTSAGVHCDYATTLGAGGLFVETEQPLPPGSVLKMRFRLPGRELLHEIEGRVVWSQPADADARRAPGMGIEFTDAVAISRLARELERWETR